MRNWLTKPEFQLPEGDSGQLILDEIKKTLSIAKCDLEDVVKAMVWLTKKEYFPGFNNVFSKYFPKDPPARSAVVNELLVDVKVEVEVIAYKPEK